MRFIYPEYGIDIELSEGTPTVIVVEDPLCRRKMTSDLWKQYIGEKGGWILSDVENELKISKNIELIVNPFAVGPNDKKLLSALHEELQDISNEEYYGDVSKLNSEIVDFLDKIFEKVPYPIESDLEIDTVQLLKMYHVRFEESEGIERIYNYIKLMHQVLGINIFVWFNGKEFMTDDELYEVYKIAAYEKIHLILIESDIRTIIDVEKLVVIDKDLCII